MSSRPASRPHRAAPAAFAVLAALAAAPAFALGEAPSPSAGAWAFLHAQLYGDREIGEVDETFMRIEAPANTPDPTATPLAIRFGKRAAGTIKQLRLIIDNNPSPLAATMDLKPGAPIDEIDLRVRIDRFTSVRAIAETTDGRLEMRSVWVNASGGCSAPPSPAADAGDVGDIRFHATPDRTALQLSIRHPNNSGFQIDPRSGDPIPPHYISHVRVSAGGQVLLDADTGISLSENPTLRLASATPLATPVRVDALDSVTQAHYTSTWNGAGAAEPAPAAAGGGL
ncbi:MAG TPA: quinoprotein dehydrogenase-associated SoxYZ-like carrier [Dokdonella sp.]